MPQTVDSPPNAASVVLDLEREHLPVEEFRIGSHAPGFELVDCGDLLSCQFEVEDVEVLGAGGAVDSA